MLAPRPVRPAAAPRLLSLVAVLATALFVRPLDAQQSQFGMDDVFDLRNVSLADVSNDGRLAVITSASLRDRIGADNHRFGDPTYIAPGVADVLLIDTQTGAARPLFPQKRQVRGSAFSPDGARIALLVREGDTFRLGIYDVASSRLRMITTPQGRILAETSPLQWTGDGAKLLVGLRTSGWLDEARRRFAQEIDGPIVVRSSEEPFLSWEDVRRLGARQIPAIYDRAAGRFTEMLPESVLGSFDITDDGKLLRVEPDITKKTNYDEIFGRELALEVHPLEGGEKRTLHESTKGMRFLWSGDGRSYIYGKEGAIFAGSVDGGEAKKIAGPAEPDSAAKAKEPTDSAARTAERERKRKERFTPVRLSYDGSVAIATNSEGYWFIDVASGEREKFLDAPTPREEDDQAGNDESPRWSVLAWSRDGNSIYLGEASRTEWQNTLHRYDRRTKQRAELLRGPDQLTGLRLSADGNLAVFTRMPINRPAEVWVADGQLGNARQLTNTNPQLAQRAIGEARLIDYLDADGRKLRGVLYLPTDYKQGTRVPTVFLVYEEFFDARFNSTVALLNANGYAVMQPSVRLERGYPGEAWLKGVTAAANKLIDLGIADPDKLGVHGTSYGGYATNLLITQTDRFKAAINISGKVDMISFYTDSPRLGTRNTHAPEKSQDRIGGTLWEQPEKYIAHSAVMYADRIDTPLLLLTGQQDHNVPERTTSEMFYALRRLGKRVEWVSYINGGHGMPTSTEAEVVDYHQRILGWYDRYLKGSAAVKADG
jgi:dipeptidyl aminopeptidase/acylaminoacyl peptidase